MSGEVWVQVGRYGRGGKVWVWGGECLVMSGEVWVQVGRYGRVGRSGYKWKGMVGVG